MNDQAITATQMVWQPPMLHLTRVAHPDLSGSSNTVCVRADLILYTQASWISLEKLGQPDNRYEPILCTLVMLQGGPVFVTESPEQVSLLRDRAFGVEQTLRRAT